MSKAVSKELWERRKMTHTLVDEGKSLRAIKKLIGAKYETAVHWNQTRYREAIKCVDAMSEEGIIALKDDFMKADCTMKNFAQKHGLSEEAFHYFVAWHLTLEEYKWRIFAYDKFIKNASRKANPEIEPEPVKEPWSFGDDNIDDEHLPRHDRVAGKKFNNKAIAHTGSGAWMCIEAVGR